MYLEFSSDNAQFGARRAYGPHKTLYNRFVRWSEIGVFDRIFAELAAESTATKTVMIDATHLKAHRTAASRLKKGLFIDTPIAASGGADRTHTFYISIRENFVATRN